MNDDLTNLTPAQAATLAADDNLAASTSGSTAVAPPKPPKQTKQEILRERARELSKDQSAIVIDDTIEIVEFLLGNGCYAFELDYLREVCPLADVTYIPCSPPFVVGVINLRGLIIPIIDILTFLDMGNARVPVFNKAVILQKDKLVIGILADEVIGATKISVSSLQHSLSVFDGQTGDYVRGLTKERMVVLNARTILDDPRLCPKNERI